MILVCRLGEPRGRGGGIAPDATANFIKKADGTPLEPDLVDDWNSLKTTGDWPKGH